MSIYDEINPIILAIYVVVAIMLVISGVSENACGFLLTGFSLVTELCLSHTGPLTPQSTRLLRSIGVDSRRVIKALQLTPNAHSYVCCPKCFACYLHTSETSYPTACTFKKTPSSAECGRRLRKSRTIRGVEHSFPVRRFIYHDFKEWLGEMLCRPGMEDLLDRNVSPQKDGVMRDIWDGPELHQLLGADGKTFIHHDLSDSSEGRYVFSFCMDGFNPFQLKQAGKKASVVAMYMICLNLPPDERYKIENMFLIGIIPGPHEPRMEEINHFLSPLVDDLLDSYYHGTWYSRTRNYSHGRYARSVLVPIICDTPASRQVTGRTSATSTRFCPYCPLLSSEINNLDPSSWGLYNDDDHRAHAMMWLQAETLDEREKIFKSHGVRYSELLRLPYWSPIRHTVVDSMHTFFLILFKRHCSEIWGMDAKFQDGDGTTTDPVQPALLLSAELQKAYIALRCEPLEDLANFSAQTLKLLVKFLGKRVKGTTKLVFINILSNYVSSVLLRQRSVLLTP
jgi:Transposase family tnp2